MTSPSHSPNDELEGRYWSGTRIGLGVVVILITAMWIWIYVWAPRSNPDRLDTRSFATAAQALCAPVEAEIDALPITTTDTTIAERAASVAEGTRLTVDLVDRLRAEAESVTDENDRKLLELWFADWDAYVADRQAYGERLQSAPTDANRTDLAFTLTERASGGIYTRTIDGFAEVNDMSACGVPRDI